MKTISAASLVKVGSNIEALFEDQVWYAAEVTKIHGFGSDITGRYVRCDLVYEDGDVDEMIRLYDEYFETNDEDGWRFVGEFSRIISIYNEAVDELEHMRSDVDTLMESVADMVSDDDDDEDEDDDSASDVKEDSAYDSDEYMERDQPMRNNNFAWYLFGNIVGIGVGYVACYIAQNRNIMEFII